MQLFKEPLNINNWENSQDYIPREVRKTHCACSRRSDSFHSNDLCNILITQHQKWLLGLIWAQGHPVPLALILFLSPPQTVNG